MEGHDAPWLQMRFLEVPEIQRHDDGGSAGNRRGQDVPVLFVVRHTGNQWLIARHPRIAKVRNQLALKIGSKPGRPPQLGLQRANSFRHNFRRPSRLVERRFFGKAEQRVAEGKVGENASIEDDRWPDAHSRLGASTRS